MKNNIKRILAILCVILIIACVITTLVLAIMGSPNFMGMLVVTLMFPVFLWIYAFIYKLLKDRNVTQENNNDNNNRNNSNTNNNNTNNSNSSKKQL